MLKIFTLLGLSSLALFAADGGSAVNINAVIMFFIFIVGTMGITKWAASKTKSASDFYTAGGGISGFQNGLAIAGDYMSAASFLGISGMIFLHGFDGMIYAIGFLVGWPIILLSFITTLIYVVRANGEFEDLETSIKNDVKDIL